MLIEAATKALMYAAALQTIGAAAAFWIAAESPVRRVGLRAAIVLVCALALRAWAHGAAVFGVAPSLSLDSLSTIVVASRWGHGWQIQMLAAAACIAAFAAVGHGRRAVQIAAAIACAALAVALTTTGHAAGDAGRMAVHAAHIFGAGLWIGTLMALVNVRASAGEADRRAMFHAFAPIAFTGAGVLVTAGLVAAWWYVGALANLWTTSYGRMLSIKLALVGGVAACGYLNWRAMKSGRTEPGPTALVELTLAAMVIVATGVLTELEHP
jgi:putative copper resistance protein D